MRKNRVKPEQVHQIRKQKDSGGRTKDVADAMDVSPSTVRKYLKQTYRGR